MFPTLSPLLQNFAAVCKPTFLGLIPWYQYLKQDTNCRITSFDPIPDPSGIRDSAGHVIMVQTNVLDVHSPFLLIALAVLTDLIRISALVAVGYIIYGGIQYIVSQGSPDSTKKAQSTIINALIGLVTAIMAASIVAFIGHKLGSLSVTGHQATTIDTSTLPNNGKSDATKDAISTGLDIFFGLVASISVLMMVIAGFRYIVAHGDPNSTAQARNTIIYAAVGLVITMVAFSVVTFVVRGVS